MADQLFQKRKGQKQKRKAAIREIVPYRYLIVCEGKKTEPNYFEGIKRLINKKYGDKIAVNEISIDRIEIRGTGRNTLDLVRHTMELRKEAVVPYGRVWCVFDKDSFTDQQFNDAINMAESNQICVAWSNEAIELWFLLHFEYLDAAISREQYIHKLDGYFKRHSINDGKYRKNLPDIYDILIGHGNESQAIRNAKKLMKTYQDHFTQARKNPGTTVYTIVEELQEYLKSI